MCQTHSSVAVRIDEAHVRCHFAKDPTVESHDIIRTENGLSDSGELARYQTPVELVPARGWFDLADFDLQFDAGRPD